jgi:hypothetical protein
VCVPSTSNVGFGVEIDTWWQMISDSAAGVMLQTESQQRNTHTVCYLINLSCLIRMSTFHHIRLSYITPTSTIKITLKKSFQRHYTKVD